jgi:prepilin-type N-terminal cleavage/methylation domain-containing protein
VLFVTFRPKLKKQAFTLIELMAVVIILGIVTTITVTAINYSIKASKDRLYAEQVKRLEAGVASWATENSSFLPVDSSGVVFFSISRLKDEGIVDTEVVMDPRTSTELDGCMTIKYDNTYQQYEYQYEDSDCSLVEDAYLPVITVTGGDAQTAEVNGYYEFPTADSVDYSGRSVTVEGPIIKKGGTIVTNLDLSLVDDVYELIYESIDPQLNLTATKTITLTVVDTVAPVITVSSSTINHEAGDTFTPATVLVSDNSCGETGIDTSVNDCITTLTPSINSGGFSPIIPGTYPIYYTATDSSGNIRVAVVNVLVADTQGPNISTLTYRLNTSAGAAYAGTWTKENVWIGNISAPDQGSGLREYRYYLTTTGDTCSTSYGSFTTLPNTATEFTISNSHNGKLCFWAVDNVFNASVIREHAILIDKLAPACGAWSPSESTWKNVGGESFTLAGSTDSGGSLINVAGGNCTTAASNGATCNVVISDFATNTTTCTSPVNNFETVAPTINFINTSTSSSYYNSASFTAITNPVTAQDVTSGLDEFRYSWTASATNPTNMNSTTCTGGNAVSFTNGTQDATPSTASISRPTTSGIHYLHVCAEDRANNILKTSSIYYLDVVNPIVSASNASSTWYASRTTTISAIDTGGSGIAEVRYFWNTNPMNGACTSGGNITTHNAVVAVPPGSNRLYVCARDGVGNTGTYDSLADQFRVDTTAPVVTIDYTDGYITTTTHSVTFTATDLESGISGGITLYRRSATLTNNTCGTYSAWDAGTIRTSPYTDTVVSGNCYQYYAAATNGASSTGNSGTTPTKTTKVDTTAPTVTIDYTDGNITTTTHSVTFSAADAQSGFGPITLYRRSATLTNNTCGTYSAWDAGTIRTSPYTDTVASGNCYQYYAATTNGAATVGNSGTSPTKTTKVDTTPPTPISITRTSSSPTNNATVSFSLSATDTQSGIAQMQFSCNNTNWSTLETYATTKSLNVTNLAGAGCSTASGTKTIYARFTNNFGLTSASTSATVVYDVTPPVLTIDYTDGYNTSGVQSITFTATDLESGISGGIILRRQSATLSDGTCGTYGGWSSLGTVTSPYSDITMGSGNCYRYYVEATNGATDSGNSGTSPTAATKVDTSGPIVTAVYTDGYNTTGTHSITMTATDAQSGASSSFVLHRRQATLTNNTCGTYGGWSSLGTTTSSYSDITMGSGFCYQYYAVGTNGAGDPGDSGQTPTRVTKVDTSAPASISVTYTDGYIRTTSQSVTFSATDVQSGIASYRVYRQSATLTNNVCGAYGAFDAGVVTTSPYNDTSLSNGNCYRYYVRATNNATLFDSTTQTPTAATKVDVGGITLTANNASSTWFASRTTTVTATDTGGSGIAEVRYNWNTDAMNAACTSGGNITAHNAVLTVPPGSNQLFMCARDIAGNTATYDSGANMFRVDSTAPSVPTLTVSEAWTNAASVAGTIAGSVDNESGILRYEYSMSGATTLGWTSGASFSVTAAGQTTVTVRAVNGAGIEGTTTSKVVSIDRTAPSVPTLTVSEAWTSAASVAGTIAGSVDNESGILRYEYSMSGATTLGWTSGASFSVTAAGQTTVTVRAVNGATMTSTTTSKVVSIDRTAPSVPTLTVSEAWTNAASVAGTIAGSVDNESGILRYEYSMSGATTLGWTSGASFSVTAAGQTTVTVRAVNGATMTSTTTSKVVSIDRTPPTFTINYTNGYNTSGTQSITFTATDAESGVPGGITLWRKRGTLSNGTCSSYDATGTSLGVRTSPYSDTTMGSGYCYKYYVSAANGAGETGDSGQNPTAETKVDISSPIFTINYTNGYNTSGTQSITFTATDAQSGVPGGITLWRKRGTLSNGTCSSYDATGTSLGVQTSPYSDTTMGSGYCYKYYVSAANGATIPGDSGQNPTAETKVDTSGPASLSLNPTSQAWTQSNVVVNFVASDAQSGVVGYRSCSTTGTSCTVGSETAVSSITLSTSGEWKVCFDAKNGAGTWSTTTCSANYAYKIDTTPPGSQTISYTNGNNTSGTQSITFSASDAESSITSYTLYRRSATLSNNTCGSFGAWDAGTVRTSPYSDTMTSGNCYQYYVTATNGVGLTASTTTSPTAITKVDTTPPASPTISYTDGYNTSGTQSITFSASDPQSGVTSYTLYRRSATLTSGTCGTYGSWSSLGTQTSPYSDITMGSGNCYQYYMTATNGVSLTSSTTTSPTAETKVDTSGPASLSLNPTSQAWTQSNVVVNFVASDAQSGVVGYRSCSTTGTSCTVGSETAVSSITLSTSGEWKVCFDAKNGAGTWSTTTCSANYAYKIDTTPPGSQTISYTNGNNTSGTQSITFSASDAESSITSYTLYRRSATLSNNTCGSFGAWDAGTVRTSPYSDTMTSGNCYQYYVTATNGVGLTASTTTSPTAITKVDTTPPASPTISYTDGYNTSGTQSITFSASDPQSGVTSYTLYRRSATLTSGTCGTYGSWSSLGTQTSPYSDITMGSGNCYQYYMTATNGVSLTSSTTTSPTAETKVDTSGPASLSLNPTSQAWTQSNVVVNFVASDAQSGVVGYRSCSTTGTSCTVGSETAVSSITLSTSGEWKVCFDAKNGAGTWSTTTCSANYAYKIDTTPPGSQTISYTNGNNTSGTQSITFSASDAESSITSYTLYRRSATLSNNTCGSFGAWDAGTVRTSPYSDTMTSGNCYQYYVTATNGVGLTASTTTSPTAITKVDTTPPASPTISYTDGYNTSGTQSITFSASDPQSGVTSYTLYRRSATLTSGTCGTYGSWSSLGTQTSPYSDITMGSGNCYQYYMTATNGVSLTSSTTTSPTAETKVDTSEPTVTIDYTDGYITTTTHSVTFSAADAQSGFGPITLYRRSATLSDGTCGTYSAWDAGTVRTSPYTDTVVSGNCYQYYAATTNGATTSGNSGTSPTKVVKVDTSAPTVTIDYTDGYITTTTHSVTFSAADAQSGFGPITLYRRSATLSNNTCGSFGAWDAGTVRTSPYTDTVVSGNCYQYYAATTNGANLPGNSGTSPTKTTKVDTTPPTVGDVVLRLNTSGGALYTNDTWTSDNVWISATSAGSDSESGQTTTYAISGASTVASRSTEYTITTESASSSSHHIVTVTTTNGANVTATKSYTVRIDNTAPTPGTMTFQLNDSGGAAYTTGTWTNQSVYVTLVNGSDALSGATSAYEVTGDVPLASRTTPATMNASGVRNIIVTTTNGVGATATRTYTEIVKIDKNAPTPPIFTDTGTANIISGDYDTTFESITVGTSAGFVFQNSATGSVSSAIGYSSSRSLSITASTNASGRAYRSKAVNMGDFVTFGAHVYSTTPGTYLRIELNGGGYTYNAANSVTHSGGGWEYMSVTYPEALIGNSTAYYFIYPGVSNTAYADNINFETDAWKTNNSSVTIRLGKDALSGVLRNEYSTTSDTGPWTTYSSALGYSVTTNTIIYARTIDNAGNASSVFSRRVRIDKTMPSTPTVSLGSYTSGYWTKDAVTMTLSSTDSHSGLLRYQYSHDQLAWTNWETYSGHPTNAWTLDSAGNWPVFYARAVDNVGNVSLSSTSWGIRIDRTNPTISITTNANAKGWHNAAALAANTNPISAQDTDSGIATNGIRYAWSTSTTSPLAVDCSSGGYAQTVTGGTTTAVASAATSGRPTTSGTWYLYACVRDQALNVASTSATYLLDVNPPTLTNITGGRSTCGTSGVTLYWTATDTGGSGLSRGATAEPWSVNDGMQFDYSNTTTPAPFGSSYANWSSINQPTTDGILTYDGSSTWGATRDQYVYFRIWDRAGNVSTVQPSSGATANRVRVDTRGPTVNITRTWTAGTCTAQVTINSLTQVGCAAADASPNATYYGGVLGSWGTTTVFTRSGSTQSGYVRSRDALGNYTSTLVKGPDCIEPS